MLCKYRPLNILQSFQLTISVTSLKQSLLSYSRSTKILSGTFWNMLWTFVVIGHVPVGLANNMQHCCDLTGWLWKMLCRATGKALSPEGNVWSPTFSRRSWRWKPQNHGNTQWTSTYSNYYNSYNCSVWIEIHQSMPKVHLRKVRWHFDGIIFGSNIVFLRMISNGSVQRVF